MNNNLNNYLYAIEYKDNKDLENLYALKIGRIKEISRAKSNDKNYLIYKLNLEFK